MKYRVIIRAEAEADLLNAFIWYEDQQPDLGRQFLDAVEVSIGDAAENPFRFPRLRHKPEVRRALVTRFPYRVFFVRRRGEIVVFRVLHGARDDREWISTIPR